MADAYGSRLVAVRRALVEALVEVDALSLCQVTYQWPNTLDFEDGLIYTRNARATHEIGALTAGRTVRKETGTFEVVVVTVTADDTQESVSDDALALGLVVEGWVAERRLNELGVDGLQTLTVAGEVRLEEMWKDGGGFLSELSIPIRFTARLV